MKISENYPLNYRWRVRCDCNQEGKCLAVDPSVNGSSVCLCITYKNWT